MIIIMTFHEKSDSMSEIECLQVRSGSEFLLFFKTCFDYNGVTVDPSGSSCSLG